MEIDLGRREHDHDACSPQRNTAICTCNHDSSQSGATNRLMVLISSLVDSKSMILIATVLPV